MAKEKPRKIIVDIDSLQRWMELSIAANQLFLAMLMKADEKGKIVVTREFREGFIQSHRYSRQSYYTALRLLINEKFLTPVGSIEFSIDTTTIKLV